MGRVQSRTYEKKYDDGKIEQKVAYEVSISNLEVISENSNKEDNQENSDIENSVETEEVEKENVEE